MLKTSLMATRGAVQRRHPAQAIADEVSGLMHVDCCNLLQGNVRIYSMVLTNVGQY